MKRAMALKEAAKAKKPTNGGNGAYANLKTPAKGKKASGKRLLDRVAQSENGQAILKSL